MVGMQQLNTMKSNEQIVNLGKIEETTKYALIMSGKFPTQGHCHLKKHQEFVLKPTRILLLNSSKIFMQE